jgi:hypothetical protein
MFFSERQFEDNVVPVNWTRQSHKNLWILHFLIRAGAVTIYSITCSWYILFRPQKELYCRARKSQISFYFRPQRQWCKRVWPNVVDNHRLASLNRPRPLSFTCSLARLRKHNPISCFQIWTYQKLQIRNEQKSQTYTVYASLPITHLWILNTSLPIWRLLIQEECWNLRRRANNNYNENRHFTQYWPISNRIPSLSSFYHSPFPFLIVLRVRLLVFKGGLSCIILEVSFSPVCLISFWFKKRRRELEKTITK